MTTENNTSNLVYVYDIDDGWLPARLVSQDGVQAKVELEVEGKKQICDLSLKDYTDQVLPLQNCDENGRLIEVEDMVDLPYLHE